MSDSDRNEEPLQPVDARLWGKREGLPGPYPVICHLIDTAAVAGVLWDVWAPGLAVLQPDVLGQRVAAQMRRLVCFWAGLHDVGKVSPSFQALVDDLYQALIAEASEYGQDKAVAGLRHHEVTQWVLVEIFQALGYPGTGSARRDVGHQIAQLLGGHHGRFCPAMRRQEMKDPRSRPGIGRGAWEEQCRAHAATLRELTGADEALRERLPVPTAVVVLGIVIVADWLASQESFITARMPGPGWKAAPSELRAHWEKSVADAPQVVRDAGLGRGLFEDRSFKELFDFDPNPLQASVMEELPDLVNGPGLVLATAAPGEGKTEMALYAAGVLARACEANGLGFCLPTMATTDAMHKRVSRFARRALLEDAALTKVHSMAWLSSDTAGDAAADAADADAVITDAQASTEATQWLCANRRGLIAPLSTFTIDQALTGVLPVKYNVLRLMAMASKVVVIDEAHSYDAWMHALLLRWLEWLGALRAPVILLSATLTGDTARSLVEAYMRGAGHDVPPELQPCYPGWLFADAVTGVVHAPRAVASERERDITFEVVPVRRDGDVAQAGHRLSVIKELLRPVVDSDRGCVLVCCTTVAEAQHTLHHLAGWFDELNRNGMQPPELRLLHSRYRARDRAAITDACERDFGKKARQRPRMVLVSTQIIEQSLDLDFDLLITDLAPMALLLQRSGRCQRHRDRKNDLHREHRPDWIGAEPHVVVLDPVNDKGAFTVPRAWGDVYDESLLHRTSRLLQERGAAPVNVPVDVQGLVDAVYAEDFAAVATLSDATAREIVRADGERLAQEAVQRQTANLIRICSPHDGKLHDLHKLSEAWPGVDSAWLTTRLGADSERLVCAYEQKPGVWTLDEAGRVAVPGWKGQQRLTRDQARLIAEYMIPVPGRYFGEGTELLDLPPAWRKNAVLAEWKLLPMRRVGGQWCGRMRPGLVRYTKVGLELETESTPYP
ncbi:CRISPR-associated helicase Cas3' [Streptosporangium algeriense]|uniref:CRISPR-associated helicase Cas3 n=1 Tax=Streptosporangium algeriense TaxID=1682748 RepID=A0ABW3DH78_9ACTN